MLKTKLLCRVLCAESVWHRLQWITNCYCLNISTSSNALTKCIFCNNDSDVIIYFLSSSTTSSSSSLNSFNFSCACSKLVFRYNAWNERKSLSFIDVMWRCNHSFLCNVQKFIMFRCSLCNIPHPQLKILRLRKIEWNSCWKWNRLKSIYIYKIYKAATSSSWRAIP